MAKPSNKLDEYSATFLSEMVKREYDTVKGNNEDFGADFEATIDMLEGVRAEKNYDWMSDVNIPEFASIFNTEASIIANQGFQTRDFVEVYLEGDTPQDMARAKAAKKLINKTLNRRDLCHYHKYMRQRTINGLAGVSYKICGWEQAFHEEKRTRPKQVPRLEPLPEDHPYWQSPGAGPYDPGMLFPVGLDVVAEEYTVRHLLKDCFSYEVVDPRNVFTDNSYVYSIQDKEFVIIRSERTHEWLEENAKAMGYMNLEAIKDWSGQAETETAKETYNVRDQHQPVESQGKRLDVLDRWGKVWAVVTERNPTTGAPVACTPGRKEDGELKKGAELIECVVTLAMSGGKSEVIRFMPTPFVSKRGKPYRPITRGLCYIHPTKDVGMSDGKYSRDLQTYLNDTINMSNDRVKLATMPTFLGNKYSLEDNDQVFLEPEHVIPLNDVKDLVPLSISSDVRGAMEQAILFIQKMQQVNSVYPTTMGDLPGKASTTATAVAGASGQSNLRSNYKELTFEYTDSQDFYWMIMQMSYQFMQAETAHEMLGDDVVNFDPDADYNYQPVTSAIELEHSKQARIRNYDQIIGRLVGIAQAVPQVMPVLAFCLGESIKAMGSEYQVVGNILDNLANAKPQMAAPGATSIPDQGAPPTSNQNQLPMPGQEQMARGMLS